MLILVSPAKTLDFETPAKSRSATQPVFLEQSAMLVDDLRKLSAKRLSSLMGISPKLGELNKQRFGDWQTPFTKRNAKQAVLAFKGDVYTGMDAESFSESDLKFAQQHLRILSGLYGVLRPLDLIQPYRLEMGTKFANDRGKNLYEFWGDRITEEINRQLKKLHSDTVVNLASNEYFKSVNKKLLTGNIVTPVFKDLSNGQYKMISFYAKKARGQMAAWIIREQLTDPALLEKFNVAGYRFNAEMSSPDAPAFTRDKVPSDS